MRCARALPALAVVFVCCAPPWTTVQPNNAGFVIDLPGPVDRRLTTFSSSKGPLQLETYSGDTGRLPWHPIGAFYVRYGSLPPALSAADAISERKQALLKETDGALEKEAESSDSAGAKVLDLVIVTQEGRRTRAKIVVAENRLIELASAHGSSVGDEAGESRFWNSFRLTQKDSM